MRVYARRKSTASLCATGLLHDLDYERYLDLETEHPRAGEWEERGYPQEVIDAVAGADFLGVRETLMAKTLYAV